MNLCDYGCGNEAKYQFKNKKMCCSKNSSSCPEVRKKRVGQKRTEEFKEKNRKTINTIVVLESNDSILCQFGCNTLAKYIIYGNKFCCSRFHTQCEYQRKLNGLGKSHIEIYGEEKSIERKLKQKEIMSKLWKDPNSKYNQIEWKIKHSEAMLNGGALKCIKAIKKISKPEILLGDLVKQLYPNCEFQHKVFNYSLDIAIPEYKIAIEYDGHYHFDTEEHIEYHKERQEKIENEGWKFYRVTMFDEFPTLEEVKDKIQKLTTKKQFFE